MFVKEAEKKKGQLKVLKVPKLRLLKYRLVFSSIKPTGINECSRSAESPEPLRCFGGRTHSERRENEFGAIHVTRGGDEELFKGMLDS